MTQHYSFNYGSGGEVSKSSDCYRSAIKFRKGKYLEKFIIGRPVITHDLDG